MLQICNGGIGEDKDIGQFTFVGPNGNSVIDYILCATYTILWKPPFCELPCSKTPTYKSDVEHPLTNLMLISFYIPKVLKSVAKKNGNRFTNKNLTPKNNLD